MLRRAKGLANFVRYIEVSSCRGSFSYTLLLLWKWKSFVIPRTSLYRERLVISRFHCTWVLQQNKMCNARTMQYTSKSNTESQAYFMSGRTIFRSFAGYKTCGRTASSQNVLTGRKFWGFVPLFLLKAGGQNIFCYKTSRRKERGKLIQMTNRYFLT